MSEFLTYCLDNWYLLLTILLTIISIILVLIKLVKNGNFSGIVKLYNIMPSLISKAEEIYGSGHGAAKLAYVLTELRTYALDNSITVSTELLTNAVNAQVETTKTVNVTVRNEIETQTSDTPSKASDTIVANSDNSANSA